MTLSNEPGYYEDGSFGVRHENVLVVTAAAALENCAVHSEYLSFESLTVAPFQVRAPPPPHAHTHGTGIRARTRERPRPLRWAFALAHARTHAKAIPSCDGRRFASSAAQRRRQTNKQTIRPMRQTKMIEPALLSPAEIAWVDAYHARCRRTLRPLLSDDARAWLDCATAPLKGGPAAARAGGSH
jgi:hypothetical protein